MKWIKESHECLSATAYFWIRATTNLHPFWWNYFHICGRTHLRSLFFWHNYIVSNFCTYPLNTVETVATSLALKVSAMWHPKSLWSHPRDHDTKLCPLSAIYMGFWICYFRCNLTWKRHDLLNTQDRDYQCLWQMHTKGETKTICLTCPRPSDSIMDKGGIKSWPSACRAPHLSILQLL